SYKDLEATTQFQRDVVKPRCMDEGSVGMSSFGDWGNSEGTSDHVIFSSDGEDSDGEILLLPMNDVICQQSKKKFVTAEDALTATAARLALLGRMHKKDRITYGFFSNLGLIAFLTLCLVLADWCAWRIVRQPLDAFYFLSPFIVSAFLVACAGYVSVPILKKFNIRQKLKRKWPHIYYSKKGTPTIGGAFFIPIGVAVAKAMSGSSTEFSGILMVTLAYAVVGLLDDTTCLIKPLSFGIYRGTKFLLEFFHGFPFAGSCCSLVFKLVVHPKYTIPLRHENAGPTTCTCWPCKYGGYYSLLVIFTFILMASCHKVIDRLDGFAGGTSALAFVAMSVAVLPICP
ncbi:ATTRANS 11: Phospho-N-acetylmuramoyl-pentapeptide-transferase-like protein, partial [Bienertia sinuspersici]